MSQVIRDANGNQITIDSDVSKIFVRNNRFIDGDFNNSTYDTIALKRGTLMGRVAATLKIIPLASGAADGSQVPLGILNEDHDVEAGDTKSLSICVSGDVVESKVVLDGADTMDTLINDRTIRDSIGADTVGVKLTGDRELTEFDN